MVAGAFIFSGCAKSPSGGPNTSTGNAPNRMTISMTLAQAINTGGDADANNFTYAFAFDDDDNLDDDGTFDGPVAIVGATNIPNGVVAGSNNNNSDNSTRGYSILVFYRAGQFEVFRRTPMRDGGEQLESARNGSTPAFVGTPRITNQGRTIQVTLNLDAKTNSGADLFRHDSSGIAVKKLDTNFITSSAILPPGSSQQGSVKAFDAFGVGNSNLYNTFDITQSGRVYTQNDSLVTEVAGDVSNPNVVINQNLVPRLDMTGFSISVVRGSTS